MNQFNYAFVTQHMIENQDMFKEMLLQITESYDKHLPNINSTVELYELDKQFNRTSAFAVACYFSGKEGLPVDDVAAFLEEVNFREYLK